MGLLPSERGWRIAVGLLLASLVPLGVALFLFLLPVSNPGVQSCGSPLPFAISSPGNQRVQAEGRDPATVESLRAQATCTERTDARVRAGFVALAVFVALAFAGAVVGLLHERHELRRAPAFETLLRERPEPAGAGDHESPS